MSQRSRGLGRACAALVACALAMASGATVCAAAEPGSSGGASSLRSGSLVIEGSPMEAEQRRVEEEARRASPEAVRARESSAHAYDGLGVAAAAALMRSKFPGVVDRTDGGMPSLSAGETVSKYLSPYAARLAPSGSSAAGAGAKSHAIVESLAPIAVSEGGALKPIQLALAEHAGSFAPARSPLPVSFPADLSQGVALPGAGVSLTPLASTGSAAASASHGALDGDAVFWGGASMGADVDVSAKPAADGFDMLVDLRGLASPEVLRFAVGMPKGARLVQETGSGLVRVVLEGQTLASIARPSAQDAQGATVPVSMSLEGGDVLSLRVPRREDQFAYPIVVDPWVTDWQLTGQRGGYAGQASPTNWRCETAAKFVCSGWGTEALTISGSGVYSRGEAGELYYPIREGSEARIAEFSTEVSSLTEGEGHSVAATVVQLENSSYQLESSEEFTSNISKSFIGVGGNCWPSGGSRWECPAGTYGSPGNRARLALRATGTGEGASVAALRSSVQIEQEKGAELAYNKTSPTIDGGMSNVLYTKGWLGPHSDSAFEIQAKDPGIGIGYVGIAGGGWVQKFPFYEDGECLGVQCNPEFNHAFTYSPSMKEGEDELEAMACDEAEQPAECASIWPQTIKVDAAPPHSVVLTGLPEGDEIGAGEYHLTAEATDGEGSTPSSGVKSIALYIDGRQVGSMGGSCTPGPCTDKSPEWTIDGRDYATGTHRFTVVATDNAGNVGVDEVLVKVHAVAPVSLGPGAANPATGEYLLGATDVSLGGGLEVSRSYDSMRPTAGDSGPLGPQWSLSMGGQQSLEVEPDGSAVITDGSGQRSIFTVRSGGEEGFISPRGDTNLTLTTRKEGGVVTAYVLADATSGTKTVFERPAGEGGAWMPSIQEGPVSTDTVSYAYRTAEAGLAEYSLPSESRPHGIVKGADGNLWFAEQETSKIGRITPTGQLTEYSLPSGATKPYNIIAGPENALWFTEGYSGLDKITTSGQITHYSLYGQYGPTDIAAGPDGAVWFTDSNRDLIGRFTPAGELATYALPVENAAPFGIAGGPDGAMWFTEYKAARIGKISMSGAITEYALPAGSQPCDIAAGPDGRLWFMEQATKKIGAITTSGEVSEYALPAGTESSGPIVAGSDGDMWYVASRYARIGQITMGGVVTEYPLPPQTSPDGLAAGPEGNLWFTGNYTEKVGVVPTSGTRDITEPTEALAPVPGGVSCSPELKRGCRALTFNYAAATTATGEAPVDWGDFAGDLTRVYYHAWSNTAKAMQTVEVAHYLYDSGGRLRDVWDPRVTPALKTTYGYDQEGHVTAIGPPGQQPWLVSYGTPAGATTPGHVVKVARPNASMALGSGVAPQDTAAPTISGKEARVGLTLTAGDGTWSGSPLSFGYQWERCDSGGGDCGPISGAVNQTYTPLEADVGHVLEVIVAATNAGGTSVAPSAGTAIVQSGVLLGDLSSFGTPGKSAGQLENPSGIAVDASGNVWVVGLDTHVQEFSASGKLVREFGSEGSGNGQFILPLGIAVAPNGNIWVSDMANNRVQQFSPTGSYISQFEAPEPGAIAVDGEGHVWVVEATLFAGSNSSVREYAAGGEELRHFGESGSGDGQLEDPQAIAIDKAGDLLVADQGNNRVEKFSASGQYVAQYPVQAPQGLAVAPEGDMWVTSGAGGSITELSPEGSVIAAMGSYGTGEDQFESPWAVAVDASGDAWVADMNTDRIQEVGPLSASRLPAPPAPASDGDAVSTIEYDVPVSGEGAPHDLSREQTETWRQTDDPVEATAIFPADEPQGWPAGGYKKATVYYRDAKGRTVNVAGPSGAVSTSEYNQQNDVVRSLSADNRSAALKEGAKSAEVAERLSTLSEYNSEGTELLGTLGPEHLVKLKDGEEVQARSHTAYSYDEGAPAEGGPYRLATKTTQGVEVAGQGEQDVHTTTTSYAGQEGLGWRLRKPTSTTVDPAGIHLTSSTVYNPSTGEVTETQAPGANAKRPTGPEAFFSFGGSWSGAGQLARPAGVATGASGDVWVVDNVHDRVQEFGAKGEFIREFGVAGTGDGQFNNPHGIAVSRAGDVYVADSGNRRVEEFNAEGAFVKVAVSEGTGEGHVEDVMGVAVDGEGHVWTVEPGISKQKPPRVQEFTAEGQFIRQFGSEGAGAGEMEAPEGIAVDASGNVWVADTGNDRIEEFKPSGEFVRMCGTQGSEDGQFERPTGIAFDGEGDVWVADKGNARLQRFTAECTYLSQVGTAGNNDGQFYEPEGVAFDGSGNMWVADTGNNRVQELTGSEFVRTFGGSGSGAGQLENPAGVAVDSAGDAWVADTGHDRVQEFGGKGEFIREFGAPGTKDGQFNTPRGIAVAPSGDVYVADKGNHRVQEFGANGEFIRAFGSEGTGEGQFKEVVAVAVDGEGHVWTVDAGLPRVQEFTAEGVFMRQFGSAGSEAGKLGDPEAIAIDAAGNVWVADTGHSRIEEFKATGEFVLAFGAPGSEDGQFERPDGIAFDAEGDLWVTDSYNSRVQRLTPTGGYLSQAGAPGNNDGQFYEPEAISIDSAGNIWVADTGNDRVQELTGSEFVRKFGGAGSGAGQLNEPGGVAADASGNVWVADSRHNRIQEFGAKGEFIREFGALGSHDGEFDYPQAIAAAPSGDIYVADSANCRVQEFNAKGEFIRAFGSEGTEPGQFELMAGIAVDHEGHVWVVNAGALPGFDTPRVEEFTSEGTFIRQFGSEGTEPGQFELAWGIAIDGSGNVWVSDMMNDRIDEFKASGEFVKAFGSEGSGNGQFKAPEGLAFDAQGDLWVADDGNDRLQRFTPEGTYLSQFGTGGNSTDQFYEPKGIAIDPTTNTIAVADSGNNRVDQWTPEHPSAQDTRTIYYTAGAQSQHPECGERPVWADLPCRTEPAAQPKTEGLPELPVSTVVYSMYDQPTEMTETVGKETRTGKISYDQAGRPISAETTSSSGKALPAVSNVYSEATGALIEQKTSEGSETKSIKSAFNSLGQITSYTDAGGASTSYEYEEDGDMRLKKITEPHGSQSYGYDATTGELSEVDDSAAGVFTAAYDLEGNIVSETYPNGMTACPAYSHTGEETSLVYYKSRTCGEGAQWFSDSAVPTAHGQSASQQSSLSAATYGYDAAGRLTEALEDVPGEGCTTRIYALDEESNRLSLTTRPPAAEGKCAAEGGTAEAHTYDEANRLTDTGVAYEPFGEISKLPAADAGGTALESGFYVDGRLAEQHQGEERIAYTLDPEHRVAEVTDTGSTTRTLINHYAGAGEGPSWTEEPVGGHWSRNIGAFGGIAAMQEEDGETVLQLEDLQGNIIATASLSETASGLLSSERQSEYGVPSTSKPRRYGWQGGSLLPRELASGVVAMGARSYIPQLGRFLQTDPRPGGSANQYAYTYGNPVNETDPSGEWTFETPGWVENVAAWGAREAEAQIAREEAARAEAERLAAEAAAAAAAQASPAPTEGGAAEMLPLGGYIGWECQYAAQTGQEAQGCGGMLASAAFNDLSHLTSKAFNEAAGVIRRSCHAKRCNIVKDAPAHAKVGLLKVINNKDAHDGGDAELGCFVGGVVGGTFTAVSSLGLATEAGAIGGCFITGGVVAAIFE